MKVRAAGDEELGELARGVGAGEDGGGEAWPEGGAGETEGGEGARGGAREGVVHGAGEARPEVGGFLGGGVGEGGRRREGEDGDEFGLGVVGEVDVGSEGGAEEVGGWGGDDEDDGEARDLEGHRSVIEVVERNWGGWRLTISDSRARAGRRVGGASRCRSMESRTRTKRKPSGLGVYLSILDSSTVSWEMVSHLGGGRSHCSDEATLPTRLSKRWRLVTHSIELTMVCRMCGSPPPCSLGSSCWRREVVMALFPVASVP